jgi:hypothetical protein
MSLIWCDGFDQYEDDADLIKSSYLRILEGQAVAKLTTTNPRTGGKCLVLGTGVLLADGTDVNRYIGDYTDIIVGIGFNPSMDYAETRKVMTFSKWTTSGMLVQCELYYNNLNQLVLYSGPKSAGVILGSSPIETINLYAWQYIEIKLNIHDTTGSAEVRVNETTVINLTNVDTRGQASESDINVVSIGSFASGGDIYYDDFYIADLNGSVNNDFLGDIRVWTLFPNADGTTIDFTIGGTTPESTRWESLAEIGLDDDVTYIESGTPTDINYVTYPDLDTEITDILAICIEAAAKKDAPGTRAMKLKCKSGASVTTLAQERVPAGGSEYSRFHKILEDVPGGTGWSVSEVNGVEAGVEVV